MNKALAIVQLLNEAVPGIAQLVILIRNQDGTITVGALLDQADTQYDDNLKQIADWMKSHPQKGA
jgi:hypothetical protein